MADDDEMECLREAADLRAGLMLEVETAHQQAMASQGAADAALNRGDLQAVQTHCDLAKAALARLNAAERKYKALTGDSPPDLRTPMGNA